MFLWKNHVNRWRKLLPFEGGHRAASLISTAIVVVVIRESLVWTLPCRWLPAAKRVVHGAAVVTRPGTVPGFALWLVAHRTLPTIASNVAPGSGPTPIAVRDHWMAIGNLGVYWRVHGLGLGRSRALGRHHPFKHDHDFSQFHQDVRNVASWDTRAPRKCTNIRPIWRGGVSTQQRGAGGAENDVASLVVPLTFGAVAGRHPGKG
jgi:hypothetical protein